MHRCSFSIKSSMSGRTLAATNDRHFLQVDSVSCACREFRLRRKKPCSGAFSGPLGGVLMVLNLQFWVLLERICHSSCLWKEKYFAPGLPKGLRRRLAKNQL